MGLDLLEYTIALEQSFGIAIPDEAAAELLTARHVADYAEKRLGPLGANRCLSQQAFYTLRAAASRAFDVPPGAITPSTAWSQLFGRRPRVHWSLLRRAVGAVEWPAFFWGADGPRTRTVGETADYLALHAAASTRRRQAPWSQREIEFVIRGLAADELGFADLPWDAQFVRDLGCG